MRIVRVSPGSLKATEGTFLDMETVRRHYELFKSGGKPKDIVLVQELNGHYYLADGNHSSYGGFLLQAYVDAKLLETDEDVRNTDLGKTKEFKTLNELVVHCLEYNTCSQREFGVEFICDYALVQPKLSYWDS